MKTVRIFFAVMALMVLGALGASAQLPSFKLKTLDGKVVDTAKISNNGKPFVVSFFATWCKPCIRELKAVHEHYADWVEETGMKVVAISIDQAQNANKVKPLVDSEGWEYEVLLDPNSDMTRAFGINGIPHILILNGKGEVVESRSGYTEGGEKHIIEKVRELIAKDGSK